MVERPTPWEQLDGVKFVLEQILEQAVEWERTRIIKLWEQEMKCGCESAMQHLIELIKGETNA